MIVIETNETMLLNVNAKLGVEKFYNVFTLGATPMHKKIFWTFGYGMGGQTFSK